MELAFSDKYNEEHSKAYLEKHRTGFWRNRSNQRELNVASMALQSAGYPQSILDLPCGAGRFWPILVSSGATKLLAADNSPSMLEVARSSQAPEIAARFELMQTSAFDIQLTDNAVDSIFCMRLIHHVGEASDRQRLLAEFYRVTRETVCISLWVDGNYQAWRRYRLERKRSKKGYQNRFVIPRETIEAEFRDAGFRIRSFHDMTPKISMWRIYVLEKVIEETGTP